RCERRRTLAGAGRDAERERVALQGVDARVRRALRGTGGEVQIEPPRLRLLVDRDSAAVRRPHAGGREPVARDADGRVRQHARGQSLPVHLEGGDGPDALEAVEIGSLAQCLSPISVADGIADSIRTALNNANRAGSIIDASSGQTSVSSERRGPNG